MKKCTYCGKEYPDDATICALDHQPLAQVGQPAVTSAQQFPNAPAPRTIKPSLMAQLREWHLYLGCIFAPMLLLFALTGIWQTMGIGGTKWMQILSAIHTSHETKSGIGRPLRGFIVLMAIAFIITTILGVLMAVNQGRNRQKAYYCLAFGIIFPLLLIVFRGL